MKQTKAIKLAYAAGFLDGEGCIDITRRNRQICRNEKGFRSIQHDLRVHISQKDGEIMDWFFGNFGGRVIMKNGNPTSKNPKSKNWIYDWGIAGLAALKFLKEVYPFLRYKRSQAELGIRFQGRKNFRGGHNGKLSENELKIRDEMFKEMKQLKHQFIKSKNPNVIEYNFKSMVQPQRLSEVTPKGEAIV